MGWIAENAGTIGISILLLAVVAMIVRRLVLDRRNGKSACGSGCACCPMRGACHKQ